MRIPRWGLGVGLLVGVTVGTAVVTVAPEPTQAQGTMPSSDAVARILKADPETRGDGGASGAPCADGVLRDDGTAESGFGWVPTSVEGRFVQEYRRDEFPTGRLESLCVCWRRTRDDADVDFEVQLYAHDRYTDPTGEIVIWIPQEEPVSTFPGQHLSGVTDAVHGTWTQIQLGSLQLPPGEFFSIGVSWNPNQDQFFFICDDESPETPRSNFWFRDDRSRGWGAADYTPDFLFVDHRGLMIRAVGGPAPVVEVPVWDPSGLAASVAALALAALWFLRRR